MEAGRSALICHFLLLLLSWGPEQTVCAWLPSCQSWVFKKWCRCCGKLWCSQCVPIQRNFISHAVSYSMWNWLYQWKNAFITLWFYSWSGSYCSGNTAVWCRQIVFFLVPQLKQVINGLFLHYQIFWGQLEFMKALCIAVIGTRGYGDMTNHCRSTEWNATFW